MKELMNEYSNKYINDATVTKKGYCKRCLNEKWMNATEKKTLYEYIHPNGNINFICFDHVGCMEFGKELWINSKQMNDIERARERKELDGLIKEGKKLLSR